MTWINIRGLFLQNFIFLDTHFAILFYRSVYQYLNQALPLGPIAVQQIIFQKPILDLLHTLTLDYVQEMRLGEFKKLKKFYLSFTVMDVSVQSFQPRAIFCTITFLFHNRFKKLFQQSKALDLRIILASRIQLIRALYKKLQPNKGQK